MNKKSPLYTRTGDTGSTSLAGGRRIAKAHPQLEAYGTIDELNANVGLLATLLENDKTEKERLINIQHVLFKIGGILATDLNNTSYSDSLDHAHTTSLEHAIDQIDAALPPLRNFILPGGTQAAAQCHVCRTICRRAERRIHALAEIHSVPLEITIYINRLSDYLFILARKINFNKNTPEINWTKP